MEKMAEGRLRGSVRQNGSSLLARQSCLHFQLTPESHPPITLKGDVDEFVDHHEHNKQEEKRKKNGYLITAITTHVP